MTFLAQCTGYLVLGLLTGLLVLSVLGYLFKAAVEWAITDHSKWAVERHEEIRRSFQSKLEHLESRIFYLECPSESQWKLGTVKKGKKK